MICLSEDVTAKIASVLLEKESFTLEQLDQAKASASEQQSCLIQVLIEDKHITQEELADEVAKLYGLKRVTLFKAGDVEDKAYSILCEDFIADNQVITISLT